jgi:predicted ABC-class ATPase
MLLDEAPRLVEAALVYKAHNPAELKRHVLAAEDQEALRAQLAERRLVAFVPDGAILPRESGVSQRPLTGNNVVAFQSPPELRVELTAPNRGAISGMGIPPGVTLIVGGGFHGKSTLLAALDRGVYDHVPGDGREYVVTRADAVRIRAEDGRSVERVNISAFVDNLPLGKDTVAFTSENASGSTSQAANIVEALEAGTRLLLVDEDTSAGNFMLRDARMQRLVPKEAEPITPFIDQVRSLYEDYSVSTVLVMGGSGDYLDVADTVIAMRDYRPEVVTEAARRVAGELPAHRAREGRGRFGAVTKRAVVPESVNPERRGRTRAQARGLHAIELGEATIDLSALEQLVDVGQTRAIAELFVYCQFRGYFLDDTPLADALARGLTDADNRGLEVLSPHGASGDYARPRLLEAVAALNRLRGLRVKQVGR